MCVFKNTDQKNIWASILFKAESKPKHKEKKCLVFFFKNQKRTYLGVQNGTFKKSIFIFVFLRLFFNVKERFMPIFIKQIFIFGPPGIFWKWKLWRTHAENLDLDFKNPTWPLVSWPILADQKKFPHSTLMYTVICI